MRVPEQGAMQSLPIHPWVEKDPIAEAKILFYKEKLWQVAALVSWIASAIIVGLAVFASLTLSGVAAFPLWLPISILSTPLLSFAASTTWAWSREHHENRALEEKAAAYLRSIQNEQQIAQDSLGQQPKTDTPTAAIRREEVQQHQYIYISARLRAQSEILTEQGKELSSLDRALARHKDTQTNENNLPFLCATIAKKIEKKELEILTAFFRTALMYHLLASPQKPSPRDISDIGWFEAQKAQSVDQETSVSGQLRALNYRFVFHDEGREALTPKDIQNASQSRSPWEALAKKLFTNKI